MMKKTNTRGGFAVVGVAIAIIALSSLVMVGSVSYAVTDGFSNVPFISENDTADEEHTNVTKETQGTSTDKEVKNSNGSEQTKDSMETTGQALSPREKQEIIARRKGFDEEASEDSFGVAIQFPDNFPLDIPIYPNVSSYLGYGSHGGDTGDRGTEVMFTSEDSVQKIGGYYFEEMVSKRGSKLVEKNDGEVYTLRVKKDGTKAGVTRSVFVEVKETDNYTAPVEFEVGYDIKVQVPDTVKEELDSKSASDFGGPLSRLFTSGGEGSVQCDMRYQENVTGVGYFDSGDHFRIGQGGEHLAMYVLVLNDTRYSWMQNVETKVTARVEKNPVSSDTLAELRKTFLHLASDTEASGQNFLKIIDMSCEAVPSIDASVFETPQS